MDFVRDDKDLVRKADVSNALKLISGPNPTNWVVWRAKEQNFVLGVRCAWRSKSSKSIV